MASDTKTSSVPRDAGTRKYDPANDAKPLHRPVWFVRRVPVGPPSGVQLHWTVLEFRRDGEEWFENLILNIRDNGMMNPLVVHNHCTQDQWDSPMMVVHGGNRYRAIRRLGWRHAPCLIVGELPNQYSRTAIALPTLAEIQPYIMDGKAANHPNGLRVYHADNAQSGLVTPNPKPYWDIP